MLTLIRRKNRNDDDRKERGRKEDAMREAKSQRCNRSHAPIRFTRRFTAVAGLVFMMRMSAPVVTLATEPPATPPGAERESVLWRADSLTHTFPGISYSQVIYDAYIALGERANRREPLYPYAILYPRRRLFLDALRLGNFSGWRAGTRARRFGFWTRVCLIIFFFVENFYTLQFLRLNRFLLIALRLCF